jgi:pyrroloquinoline quinone (PQQ) biosynthesis protein C
MKISSTELLRELEQLQHKYYAKPSPVYQMLYEGRMTKRQLQEFIGQFSIFPLYNHNYHGRLYIVCPDYRWRSRIAEVTYEEGTGRLFAGGTSHHELYLRFGEAAGIAHQQLYDWPLCAEAVAYRDWFMNICGRSFIEGASAHMLASESVGMTFYTDVANALKKHFGFSDEGVRFWTVHAIADEDHTDIGRELLDGFAKTEADQHLVRKSVEEAHQMFRLLDEGTYRAVVAVEKEKELGAR